MLRHKEKPYYRKAEEFVDIDTCGTGFDWSCTAHEDKNSCPVHKHKKRFSWDVVLIVLFFALLIFDTLYGGFNPLLFPEECG